MYDPVRWVTVFVVLCVGFVLLATSPLTTFAASIVIGLFSAFV